MGLLKLSNITKKFGDLKAVNDLSFEVEENCIYGIAGPNGAGKTTLFNVISGLYKNEGKIIFEDKEINDLRPHKVCHLGIARTFQFPNVFSTMKVKKNIEVGAHYGKNNGDEKKITKEIIDYLGLQEKIDLLVKDLPLFDKKMVMLGAALATKPKLLMLDEPLGGLSPREIKLCTDYVKRINEEFKVTIIMIEHLMKHLIDLSDKMLILHEGKKIFEGFPEDVVSNEQVLEVYLGKDYEYA